MINFKRIISLLIILFFVSAFNIPKKINSLIEKEVKLVFKINSFEKEAVTISEELNKTLLSKVTDCNLQRIKSNNEIIGYYYFGKAFGKVDYFDFVVIFDKNLVVSKVKILVYREDHGAEIKSKRWLKQFIGKSSKNSLKYPKNVVGISGATISVKSMTNAVNNVFKTMSILKNKQLL